MYYRLSVPLILAAALAVSARFPSLAEAQMQRGTLPSRSLPPAAIPSRALPPCAQPFRFTLTYHTNTQTQANRSSRFVHPSAPPRVRANAPGASPVPPPGPLLPRSESHKIAVGAYFWQDGKCAPGDNSAVTAWRDSVGRLPAVWLIFQGWTGWNEFPAAQAERARELGGQLLVTWEPWSNNVNDARWSCSSIASGSHDTYIRRYARAVRDARVPVMLRFAHEMNGNWYPWGTAFNSNFKRHNGNSPQQYVAMWRRVVGIFRQEGATNAKWVWAPNIHFLNDNNSLNDQNRDLAALYPGDNYVDWIGLSVYNDGARRSWNSFSMLIDGAYHVVTRISSKPLMIAEMGATEAGAPSGTSKAAWIEQALNSDIPNRYPRVKLVNWFCRDKTSLGEANYRFDSSPASLRAFRYAINSPLYSGQMR